MSGRATRVLVADDSVTLREAITSLLGLDPRLQIVGHAADGLEAVRRARELRPDVITMDVQMPHLDGLSAISEIMESAPTRILVVSSVAEDSVTDLSMRALAAGALEVIPKPRLTDGAELRSWGRRLAESIWLMGAVPVVTRRAKAGPAGPAPMPWGAGAVDAFGIVASTGGPQAVVQVLSLLPPTLPVPLFVAQHIGEGFTGGLARWFASVTGLRVGIAEAGAPSLPGHVYLPPDGCDLEVERGGLLRVRASPGGACPSGDRLLASMARIYGERAGGVVLTGMGEDGARGLLAVREAGGVTAAQDEASSVVYGMPQAARRLGAAECIVTLAAVAPLIAEVSQRRGRPSSPAFE